MKNLKKLKRNELKIVSGGNPTRVVCQQHMTQFVEQLPEDYCSHEENVNSLACQCKRLYGF